MLRDFISKQTAFNKSVEEKFDKIDTLASKVDSLALDVDILKSKVMSHDTKDGNNFASSNAIQVRIDDNMRLLAELHAVAHIKIFLAPLPGRKSTSARGVSHSQ